jgi:hypothetical protein
VLNENLNKYILQESSYKEKKMIEKGEKECVNLPESKKGVSLKFVLPRKERVFLRRGILARCEKIPALNCPKKTGHNAPSVHCRTTSRALVSVAVVHTFVTNIMITCFELIYIHSALFRNSPCRGTQGKVTKYIFFPTC